jgi:hypothetical protein
MAAQNEMRDVWCRLRRGGEDVGDVDEISVSTSANVAKLRNAVKEKFAEDLVGVTAARLTVSRSANPSDETARLLPDAAVPTDTAYVHPLYIHFEAPPGAAPGARRPSLCALRCPLVRVCDTNRYRFPRTTFRPPSIISQCSTLTVHILSQK